MESCILSKFYIKPQLKIVHRLQPRVVSYRNSTSNHNNTQDEIVDDLLYLIEILHQTTTKMLITCNPKKLYLIEILHQTTTGSHSSFATSSLYLIEILHQTTTWLRSVFSLLRCILSKFYIKPQHPNDWSMLVMVVSYRNSTSNHNQPLRYWGARTVVSYRNSTSNHNSNWSSFHFFSVVSYRNSTSNHN